MLNDLSLLRAGAIRMGVASAVRHPQVQAPGRVTALQVRLDESGEIAALGVLLPEDMAHLWTFRDGNQNAFPFVQLKTPLLGADAVLNRDEPEAIRETLAALVHDHISWSTPFGSTLISRCEGRRDAVAGIDPASACVPAVLERGVTAMRDPSFVRRLAEAILAHEADGRLGADGLALAKAALVGDAKGRGGALYFDVAAGFGGEGHGQSTTDVTFEKWSVHAPNVAAALPPADGAASGVCGLTGEMALLHSGPFPKPTLPVVGGAFIYARNVEATPASLRYGSKAPYPVRGDLPPELAGAVEALTRARREGQSWRAIPSERIKESDLLIAALEVEARVALADFLAGGTTVSRDEAEDNEVNVQQVIETLDAKLVSLGQGETFPQATLLLLRKIDPGNVKAILSRRLSADILREMAARWAKAQDNAPPIKLTVRVGTEMRTRSPYAPAPLQLPALTRTTYLREGTERAPKPAQGLRPQDALGLFLDDPGADRIAAGALSAIVRRQGGLLIETAHALHRGARSAARAAKDEDDFNRDALRAVGALGLLLAKSGRDKEHYMDGNAYRLGQLFAAADAIHAGYCADVRGGSMPPTLLGNELLGVAQGSAVKGLDLMLRRIRPYLAWAKRQAPPRSLEGEAGLSARDRLLRQAFWGFRDLERLSRSIDLNLLHETPGDRARAEMILGYLAGSYEARKKDKNEGDEG